jgi:hypothetical protein
MPNIIYESACLFNEQKGEGKDIKPKYSLEMSNRKGN